jgi:hypothetical protein
MLHRLSLLLFLSLTLLTAQPTLAREPQEMTLTDTVLTVSQDHLLLFTTLTHPLTEELIRGLHNGLNTKIIFSIELDRTQTMRSDERLITLDIEHTLIYDTLKQDYRIERSEQPGRTSILPTLESAIAASASLNNLRLIELSQLRGISPYRLRLKARIANKQLPMNLHYLTDLLPWGDRETDWQTVEFSY